MFLYNYMKDRKENKENENKMNKINGTIKLSAFTHMINT